MSDTAGIAPEIDPRVEAELTTEAEVSQDSADVTEETDTAVVAEDTTVVAEVTDVVTVTEAPLVTCLNNFCLPVSDSDDEVTTAAAEAAVLEITAEAVTEEVEAIEEVDSKLVISEVPVNPGPAVKDDETLNEIDTGSDKFFVSQDTVNAAKKYGYKILLKKVGGKEVPVGR